MKKMRLIRHLIVLFVLLLLGCETNRNSLSRLEIQPDFEGHWIEQFEGLIEFEQLTIPDEYGHYTIVAVDSIRKQSSLTINRQRFILEIREHFYAKDSVYQFMKLRTGLWKADHNVIKFVDDKGIDINYRIQLIDESLSFDYLPDKPDGSLIVIPPEAGYLWGETFGKHTGKFLRQSSIE